MSLNTLWIKMGVLITLKHLRDPHFWRVAEVAVQTSPRMKNKLVVITSGVDGVHSRESFHYEKNGSNAWDIRVRNIKASSLRERKAIQAQWARDIEDALGCDFDVVNEGTHIHIEYDPK